MVAEVDPIAPWHHSGRSASPALQCCRVMKTVVCSRMVASFGVGWHSSLPFLSFSEPLVSQYPNGVIRFGSATLNGNVTAMQQGSNRTNRYRGWRRFSPEMDISFDEDQRFHEPDDDFFFPRVQSTQNSIV